MLANARARSCLAAAAADCDEYAALRVELVALDPRSAARARCEAGDGDAAACSRWSSEVFGAETDQAEAAAFMARAVAMCRAGKASGCMLAAEGSAQKGAPKIDERDVAERGCRLKYWGGCVSYAHILAAEGKAKEAFDALRLACEGGETDCGELADWIEKGAGPAKGPEQRQMLANARARSCLAAAAADCDKYAALRRSGAVAKGELPAAQEHEQRCEKYGDCYFAAAAEALGIGVPRDLAKAKKSFERFCATPAAEQALGGKKCELPRSWQ
jgi:hypothetical protein